MNDNEKAPNPALRAHVTDHSFVLTLRKSHIWALEIIANDEPTPTRGQWVGPAKGLEARGLIEHRGREPFAKAFYEGRDIYGGRRFKTSNHWRLTRAGWAVYDLLAEAGMVRAMDRRAAKRRLVA